VKKIDSVNFGARLLEAFEGTKSSAIAQILGLTEGAISNYVSGRVPKIQILDQIASFTNCNLHWLLTGEGEKFVRSATSQDQYAIPHMRIQPISETSIALVLVKQVTQLSVQGVMASLPIESYTLISPLSLRERSASEVIAITILDDFFNEAGYEKGGHLLAVPFAADDLQDNDLVIAKDDKRVWIRRYRQRGNQIALAPRFGHGEAYFYFPEDVEILFRVVG